MYCINNFVYRRSFLPLQTSYIKREHSLAFSMHRDSNTHHLRVAKRSDETLRADFLPITGRLYKHHKTLPVVVASTMNLITPDRSVIEATVQHCRPVTPL